MSNSPLVDYTKLTRNHSGPRTHAIDTITIHCFVGQVTAKSGCDYFYEQGELRQQIDPETGKRKGRDCSANYVVGFDGSIGLSVDEGNRSWCSSNRANDQRAVTIEVACDPEPPYAVTDEAYFALQDLLVDICRRNGIEKLLWRADKSLVGQVEKQNMTLHRWFAAKECPGDWLYERHGEIADAVNARLRGNEWSRAARDWAVDAGLIAGYSNGDYGWRDPVTREQLAVILKRYTDKYIKE